MGVHWKIQSGLELMLKSCMVKESKQSIGSLLVQRAFHSGSIMFFKITSKILEKYFI